MPPILPRLPVLGALLAVAIAGCATPGPRPPANPPPPAAAEPASPAPAATLPVATATAGELGPVGCWSSNEEVTLAAGGGQPGARRVLRRRAEPAAGRIVEDILRRDPRPEAPPRLYTVVYRVADDGSYTFSETGDEFAGTGELTGPAARRSGWTSHTRLPSGIAVEESAHLRADGVLEIVRDVSGPDGQEVMTLREAAEPLTADDCTGRLTAAAPPPGS